MWEERYTASQGYHFGTDPAGFLTENPGWLAEGLSALAVADGEGRNSVHMAEQGMRVTAFDISPTAIERAHELAKDRGVTIDASLSDLDSWDWRENAYDMVVAIFIQFMSPPERKIVFENMKATLKPGGILMLHGYRPEQIALGSGGPKMPENMYTEDMLREEFAGWKIERLASYERDVQEGRGHSGKSALIDLIARKP